jgi:hypothetical protein
MPDTAINASAREDAEEPIIPLSEAGTVIRDYVRQALRARNPVGYDRKFLDRYRPNSSSYLTKKDRTHLAAVGRPQIAEQPAGTYAKQILNRLLIDLAWNSSRLEGNTYSLLDTERLIELGEEAEGRAPLEAQMILNHKDAIELLVGNAETSSGASLAGSPQSRRVQRDDLRDHRALTSVRSEGSAPSSTSAIHG